MHIPRRLPRGLALAGCAVALLGTTGCQQALQNLSILASALPGASNGNCPNSPGFSGASLGGLQPGGVPGLNAPGVTGPSPSSGVTPPASATSIQEFQQQYGIEVTGSAATPENLQRLSQACQYYDPTRHLQGLQQVELVDRGGPMQGTAGVWMSNGVGARITLYAFSEGGANGNVISRHAAVHELGHHVCELTGARSFTPQLDQNIQASPQPVPTQYAATQTSELRAETVATLLNGNVERPPGFLPNYQPSQQLIQQVRSEFPRAGI